MNTQALPVTDEQNEELESFLVWFTQQPEIPENERIHFLEHVQKVGGIDEQAAQFIEDNMNMIELIRQAKVNTSETKAKTILGCMNGEKLSKQSAKKRMVETTGKYITDIASRAVKKVKAHDKKENEKAETNQHETELNKAQALKDQLGA